MNALRSEKRDDTSELLTYICDKYKIPVMDMSDTIAEFKSQQELKGLLQSKKLYNDINSKEFTFSVNEIVSKDPIIVEAKNETEAEELVRAMIDSMAKRAGLNLRYQVNCLDLDDDSILFHLLDEEFFS